MSAGDDTFDGGDGEDAVTFSGSYSSYQISGSGENTLIADPTGAEGTNTLVDIERAAFSDGILALDVDEGETAGQAYRLYQAAFARTPDLPGVKYHMNDLEANSLVLVNVANNFMASPEFTTKYGASPSDNDFINLLYQNVLSRTPGDSEVSWYQNQFDTGAMTRAAALIGFAESPENVTLVAPQIEDGIWLAS